MHYHPLPQGKSIQKAMLAEFKKHDPYRPVTTAEPSVSFNTDEGGTVVGTGSADFDHSPVTCTDRKMYAGRITVGVLTKNLPRVRLFAKAEHLKPAALEILLQSAEGPVELATRRVDDVGGHLAN